MKEEEVIKLSNLCNFNADYASPLKNEASGREYWRVSNNKESFVLCYLDPKKGNHSDFIKFSKSLKDNDVNSVDILYHNISLGVTLQKDLGDSDLLSILNQDNKIDLLQGSLDLLIKIQNSKIDHIKHFSEHELSNQINLFKDIFCMEFLGLKTDISIDDLISSTMQNLMIQPWVNCHFDFERRNLILNQEQITVIDYQDMKIGPIGIDLSGILIDHYYNVDFKNIENMLNYFSKKSKVKYSNSELLDFLRWGCIQRNMRILGTLANLYLRQRRDFRLKDLSMILTNLLSMIPDDFEARNYILDKIQPKLEKRISKI